MEVKWVKALNKKTGKKEKVATATHSSAVYHGENCETTLGAEIESLKTEVSQLFQSASNGKLKIANAITGKDESLVIPASPTFDQLAELIGQIASGMRVVTGSMQEFTTPSKITGEVGFTPKLVIVYNYGSGITNVNMGIYVSSQLIGTQISDSAYGLGGDLTRYANPFTIKDTGFEFSNHGAVTNLKWIALG